MTELMQASQQWASRPRDERFCSLAVLGSAMEDLRCRSKAVVVANRKMEFKPDGQDGLRLYGPNGHGYAPTHWAAGQLASLAGAPAGYLRTLPAALAADCLNFGLRVKREVQEIGILLTRGSGSAEAQPQVDPQASLLDQTIAATEGARLRAEPTIRAATGPNYGRVWNSEVVTALRQDIGEGGLNDAWRIPGIFGKALAQVTPENTTLFAGDRDLFVFLADEDRRIEIPNRRDGKAGSLARGFFVWNSEVGSGTLGVGTFLFDYACSNRIVWGAQGYGEIRVRHTAGAPSKFIEAIKPALRAYAEGSARGIEEGLRAARAARVDDLEQFLAKRKFTAGMGKQLQAVHELEEGRPISTLWDTVVAVTALAKSKPHQDDRVGLERQAGAMLQEVMQPTRVSSLEELGL